MSIVLSDNIKDKLLACPQTALSYIAILATIKSYPQLNFRILDYKLLSFLIVKSFMDLKELSISHMSIDLRR